MTRILTTALIAATLVGGGAAQIRTAASRRFHTTGRETTMTRNLFTHPTTPAEDGWATFTEPEIDDAIDLDPATERLVADVERQLRETIGSVPSAWFHAARTAA
jgi:hypothetical protein